MSLFKDLGLSPEICSNASKIGFIKPTEIQTAVIPKILSRMDLLGISQTGTGKSAAFILPIIQNLITNKKNPKPKEVKVLILSPTRELAIQLKDSLISLSGEIELKVEVAYGGVSRSTQIDSIELGLDVLIATPGRLLDIINHMSLDFVDLACLVLDEADNMLDMGFLGDVKKIISYLPEKKQSLLFSASMPKQIEELANDLLKKPVKVQVSEESSVVDLVDHSVCFLEKSNKMYLLQSLLENEKYSSVLLFCKTKLGGDRLVDYLNKIDIKSESFHSNKSQRAREEALSSFKDGNIRILVATDVAARGIDISNISLVVNYNLPEDPRSYLHRIGRTARAGREGKAVSFCTEFEFPYLKNIEKTIRQKIRIDESQPFHKDILQIMKESKRNSKKNNKKKRKSR